MKMNDLAEKGWEYRLRETAAHFDYPPTPDIASAVRRQLVTERQTAGPKRAAPQMAEPAVQARQAGRMKLLIGVAAALLIMFSIAMAVPQVRAAVLELLQIGAIRLEINEGQPGTTAPGAESATRETATPAGQVQRPADLVEGTSLAQAAALLDFPLHLPTYPADLGRPDRVYIQHVVDPGMEGQILVLDWLDPSRPDERRLSLYQIGVPYYGVKEAFRESLQETKVLGQFAVWITEDHQLQVQGDDGPESILVTRDVLVWSDEVVTYRLESDLSMEEAVRVAESLELFAEE